MRLVSILKTRMTRFRSPLAALIDSSPAALAGCLLDEIERGMVPVWPTTERYADRLVDGLIELRGTREREVHRAVLLAPLDTQIDWPERLEALIA
jgi:hypothetical protein